MKVFQRYVAVFVCMVIFTLGMFFGGLTMGGLAKANQLNGYHCQPITTHSTLEDAKAQVERYQERVK